jgi:hypothetical protein
LQLTKNRTSKLQKTPWALEREHPALQKMKFLNFFLLLWVVIALLDTDPDSEYGSESGSTDPIESGSNWDPDPDSQPWKIYILVRREIISSRYSQRGKFRKIFFFFYTVPE